MQIIVVIIFRLAFAHVCHNTYVKKIQCIVPLKQSYMEKINKILRWFVLLITRLSRFYCSFIIQWWENFKIYLRSKHRWMPTLNGWIVLFINVLSRYYLQTKLGIFISLSIILCLYFWSFVVLCFLSMVSFLCLFLFCAGFFSMFKQNVLSEEGKIAFSQLFHHFLPFDIRKIASSCNFINQSDNYDSKKGGLLFG